MDLTNGKECKRIWEIVFGEYRYSSKYIVIYLLWIYINWDFTSVTKKMEIPTKLCTKTSSKKISPSKQSVVERKV